MDKIYDVVIIGGGPGGYTAALYCARAGLSTMVLEKLSAGGQMALTSQIDNYPGFEEGIDGFSLAEKMQQGAERFGAETELAEVLSVDLRQVPFQENLECRERKNWLDVALATVLPVMECFTETKRLWLLVVEIQQQRMP